jgi:tyrosine-protein kinase Etk/Wzc
MSESEAKREAVSRIHLLDIATVLAKHKLLVLGVPLLVGILAVIYAWLLPNIYTATTRLLPPQQNQSSASAVLSQLGNLGLSAPTGKNTSEIYIAILRSRTLADSLIDRLDLNSIFKQKLRSGAREALRGMTTITATKDGLISIDVDDQVPKRAAQIANAYVEELYKINSVLALTEASQRRLFFERQFAQARDNLVKAEYAAKTALEKGGLAQVEGQARSMLEMSARLRGQITVKEVQIAAQRSFATENNPEIILAQKEIEAMRRELARIEGAAAPGGEGVEPRRGRGMDNFGLMRNLKYYETLYEMLSRQYEVAKLDEAKDASLIQVLDSAVEPDTRSRPQRRRIVTWAVAVAAMLAIALAFMLEAIRRDSADPEQRRRLERLRASLIGR